jgi:hypothetical protein
MCYISLKCENCDYFINYTRMRLISGYSFGINGNCEGIIYSLKYTEWSSTQGKLLSVYLKI